MFLKKVIKPKIPSLKNSKLIEKDLSGTVLSFNIPEPTGDLNSGFSATPHSIDIYENDAYAIPGNLKDDYKGDARELDIFNAAWDIKASTFGSAIASLVMGVDVFAVDVLPHQESMFDNAILAREVYREAKRGYTGLSHEGYSDIKNDLTDYVWPNYLFPLQWQWLKGNGCEWLHYEAQPLYRPGMKYYWVTPIGPKNYLRCHFGFSLYLNNAGNPYRAECKAPINGFSPLIYLIMDSFKLELSGVAKVEREKILKAKNLEEYPSISPSQEEIEQAEYVLYMWSNKGYEGNAKEHREDKQKIAEFLRQRISPRALPGRLA